MAISSVVAGESFADALHINGDNAMTGDLNGGGQDATNFANVKLSGQLTVANQMILDGSSAVINTIGADRSRGTAILGDSSFGSGSYIMSVRGGIGGTEAGDVVVNAGTNASADIRLLINDEDALTVNHDKSVSLATELRTGGIADQGAYDLQAKDAIVTDDLTVGSDILFMMGKGIKWVTDSTNYVYFYGASPTQAVMQFVVDGVTSNTLFNL